MEAIVRVMVMATVGKRIRLRCLRKKSIRSLRRVSFKSIVNSAVDEKDNPKVSKVSDESNKAAVVALVIEKVPVATESVKASVAKESVKAPC
ncbi:hypothetical protein Tco_1578302 [Tanacetum coccineum]